MTKNAFFDVKTAAILDFSRFWPGHPGFRNFFGFFSQNGVSTHKVIKLGGAQRVLKH